jgi:hypothetical protein
MTFSKIKAKETRELTRTLEKTLEAKFKIELFIFQKPLPFSSTLDKKFKNTL